MSWAPSSAGAVGYNVYRRIHRFDSEAAVHIVMDGAFSDWDNILPATSHPYPPEDLIHIQDVWVANDKDTLYVRVKYSSSVSDALEPSIWLDVDRDAKTGSGSKNWRGLSIGAELWYDIRYVGPDGTPYIRSRTWDPNWKGPYSYESFYPVGYADPVWAWGQPETWIDLPRGRWAVGDDGVYDDRGKGLPLRQNGWEVSIPFAELTARTGKPIDARKFGIDMFFSAYWDQFPTVGYAPKSPKKFEYGYKKVNAAPIVGTSYLDNPIGGLTYDYYVFDLFADGHEEPHGSPTSVVVTRAHPSSVNASIVDAQSLKVQLDYPEDPRVEHVVVVRRTDRYPESPSDGTVIGTPTAAPGAHVQLRDEGLTSGQAYFYTAFGTNAAGETSQEFWDTKDRSIPSVVRGPIPDFGPSSDFMVYFASWDDKRVEFAKKYDLVVLHPGGGAKLITRKQVADIKAGLDGVPGTKDDVRVVCYVSIGEDFGLNPKIIRQNTEQGLHPNANDYPHGPWESHNYYWPRLFPDNTTGPVHYDFDADRKIYSGTRDPKYKFPSFYTDVIDYYGQGGPGQDGLPDQNIEWGGLFVDAGDPAWQSFIRGATADKDYVSGIDWVLGNSGDQLNCDGIFLDTIGVSSPWSAWFPGSLYGDLFWLKDGHLDFMAKIGTWYPDKIIMPNRPNHLTFPGFAGKRFDDFRAVTSALFWESYSADVKYWWPGYHAKTLENSVIAAQDDSDGRGFSTLALDYWRVMVDAEDGGEFQHAPWYAKVGEFVDLAQSRSFVPHAQGSRALDEMTDYVFLHHNPSFTKLPDLYVHSIRAKKLSNDAIQVTVQISNQGQSVTRPFDTSVQLNDTQYASETIAGLGHNESHTFERTVKPEKVGNNLLVHVDAANVVEEYDEQPGYVESNNWKSKYLDRYFSPVEGWKPEGIRPDVTVTKIETEPKFPAVGQEVTLKASYSNVGEGVATDSRMYTWMGTAEGGAQVGNDYTPYLMPHETKIVKSYFTPSKAGSYSIGMVADGSKKIIEDDSKTTTGEQNNEGSGALLVLSTSNRAPLIDWKQAGVLGPVSDPKGDAPAPAGDIVNVWIYGDGDNIDLRLQFASEIEVSAFQYTVILDVDMNPETGYRVAGMGGDFMIRNGDLYRYAGTGSDWSWVAAPYKDHPSVVVETDEHFMDLQVSRSALGMPAKASSIGAYYTASALQPATANDGASIPAYTITNGPIRIDGKFADWDARSDLVKLISRSGRHSGYDENSKRTDKLSDDASIQALWALSDAQSLYLRLRVRGTVDFSQADYFVFLDLDGEAKTGYQANWGTIGAEAMVWNGVLYRHQGGASEWNWTRLEGAASAVGTSMKSDMETAVDRTALGWSSASPIRLFVMAKGTNKVSDFAPDLGEGGVDYPGGKAAKSGGCACALGRRAPPVSPAIVLSGLALALGRRRRPCRTRR